MHSLTLQSACELVCHKIPHAARYVTLHRCDKQTSLRANFVAGCLFKHRRQISTKTPLGNHIATHLPVKMRLLQSSTTGKKFSKVSCH